jgi:hypothetical protein
MDPIEEFNAKVDEFVAQGKPRHIAVQQVSVKYPELREAYVQAHNELHGRRPA